MTNNTNDRELLELAAIAYTGGHFFGFDGKGNALIDPVVYCPFNPLENDGDALRLAVACQLGISIVGGRDGLVECVSFKELHCFVSSREIADDGDIESATRRAIVRAAAEIGRQM